MDLTKKRLQKAVKEFNKVVQLADEDGNPTPIDLKSKNLEKDLYEAMEFIEEGDEFSDFTDAVFNELKIRYENPPEVKDEPETENEKPKKKKGKKAKAVEVGTTVELDADNDEIKKESKMEKNEMREAAELVLSRTAKKDELMELLDTDLFSKKQKKELKKVGNFLSLKKQMKKTLDPDVVAEVEAELKAAPKPKAKPKAKKESPLVAEIKEATKVKHLKKIAKANAQFKWKKLKKLEEFEEIQKAMLKSVKGAKTKAEPKVVMVPNPLIEEIESFEKAKKLAKWVKNNEDIEYTKGMKKMDLADLQELLIDSIPAKVEKEDKNKKREQINHIDQEARKERIIELVDEGNHTRKEIHAILQKEFPEEGKSHTNSNILSECKSMVPYKDGHRWERFGIGQLVTEDENGCYVWADKLEEEKPKSKKKDKKSKKDKKKNKKSKK